MRHSARSRATRPEATTMKQRALALAGLVQAVKLVQRTADDGIVEAPGLEAILASIFRIDADSVESVYGSAALLRPGLADLVAHFEEPRARNPATTRIAATVLHVERRLSATPAMLRAIGEGVRDVERQREHFGITDPTVIGRLGDLYADTISGLSPRVLVQGNPLQLARPEVVARIRALLLAAMRSAVLWRQLGGSYWDLLLRRRAIVQAARAWLGGIDDDSA
jgi:high frequency lysogenization protein